MTIITMNSSFIYIQLYFKCSLIMIWACEPDDFETWVGYLPFSLGFFFCKNSCNNAFGDYLWVRYLHWVLSQMCCVCLWYFWCPWRIQRTCTVFALKALTVSLGRQENKQWQIWVLMMNAYRGCYDGFIQEPLVHSVIPKESSWRA